MKVFNSKKNNNDDANNNIIHLLHHQMKALNCQLLCELKQYLERKKQNEKLNK